MTDQILELGQNVSEPVMLQTMEEHENRLCEVDQYDCEVLKCLLRTLGAISTSVVICDRGKSGSDVVSWWDSSRGESLPKRSSVIRFPSRLFQPSPICQPISHPTSYQSDLPTIQYLVHHINWLIRLLTAALAEQSELSPSVAAFDTLERDSILHSQLWFSDLPADADLRTVLMRLKQEYDKVLRKAPMF